MATWKKVIVSGSNAILNQVNVGTNQQITTLSSTTFLSGSFSGSFYGDGSNLTGLVSSLHITGSVGSGSLNLKSQGLIIEGTANETTTIVTSGSSGVTVTVGLPDDVTITGDLTLGGNDIKASDGNTNITLTSNTLTTFAGDIKVGGNDIQSSTGQSVFTLNGDSATANNDLTVLGDLTVAGTASFNNQTSLLIADRFALLASGSSTLTDGGIIVSSGLGYSGSAWYLESSATGDYGRWAVAPNVDAAASSATPDEYGVTAKINQASDPAAAPTWGGASNGSGNIWVTNAGDIWIYA